LRTEPVQTKREIQALLASAGLRPSRRLGQSFLSDGNLMRRLAASAALSPRDLAVEVGGGTGGLTDLLVDRVAQVVCVEMDRGLFGLLVERFGRTPAVKLIRGDILETKHKIMPEVARQIGDHDGGVDGAVKLVANLPYQAATPVVMNLLVDHPQVRRLCFTVQAEVGERITARPGCRPYGPLSITSQALCRIKTIARIPPQAFWPKPKVDSVMLRMDVGESPFAGVDEVQRFASLVRKTFDHRRKTLRSALALVLDEPLCKRVCDQCDATRRPQQLAVSEWVGLFRTVSGETASGGL
jgi:16S rRNA (adenine1518-N6/adenine1519-N6)-dimethyltransferase